ncbi:MAG: HlyD family secretion protein [Nitrospirae bacterium]|nr:HlyD family secretion protein [Nitrospirota bacterium]
MTGTSPTTPSNNKRGKIRLRIGVVVVLLTLAGSFTWWLYWSRFVWTDDARIDGDIVLISSKVQGRVARLLVEEGEVVRPGGEVAVLHDAEIRESVAEIRHALEVQREEVRLSDADLARVQARLDDLRAGARSEEISRGEAEFREAGIAFLQAKRDWERITSLFRERMVSASDRDRVFLSFQASKERLSRARADLLLLKAGERPLTVEGARAEVQRGEAALAVARSRVKEMEASLRRREETLKETVIHAEQGGVVAEKIAQTGEVVQPGQPIYRFVGDGRFWVSVNVEETEIDRVRIGQAADLDIDAYPGAPFQGKVFYIGPAALSTFSLFPAQNAPGTFVKVTQRIPVKISIDSPDDFRRYPRRPGMSVEVKIRVD